MRALLVINLSYLLLACNVSKNSDKTEFTYQYIPFSSSTFDKTDKNEIKIYYAIKDIPGRYEELGVFKFSDDSAIDYDVLKSKASNIGGHGLLLTQRGIILIRLIDKQKKDGYDDKS